MVRGSLLIEIALLVSIPLLIGTALLVGIPLLIRDVLQIGVVLLILAALLIGVPLRVGIILLIKISLLICIFVRLLIILIIHISLSNPKRSLLRNAGHLSNSGYAFICQRTLSGKPTFFCTLRRVLLAKYAAFSPLSLITLSI